MNGRWATICSKAHTGLSSLGKRSLVNFQTKSTPALRKMPTGTGHVVNAERLAITHTKQALFLLSTKARAEVAIFKNV